MPTLEESFGGSLATITPIVTQFPSTALVAALVARREILIIIRPSIFAAMSALVRVAFLQTQYTLTNTGVVYVHADQQSRVVSRD